MIFESVRTIKSGQIRLKIRLDRLIMRNFALIHRKIIFMNNTAAVKFLISITEAA